MITLKTYAPDTGTPAYWQSYAKAMGRRFGAVQAATHYASTHGAAIIHHADDSATILWREMGFTYLRIVKKRHAASAVRWIT
jgi:hypothetical protein